MKVGQKIVFDLETWLDESDKITMIEHTVEVKDICIDPCGRHESKCGVEVNSNHYGIPFSQVKKVIPANGEQLVLF